MIITEVKDKYTIYFKDYYKEFEIQNHSDIRRAKVPHNIKKGDIFNIYRGESTKEGCAWEGCLKNSLINHLK